MNIKKEYKNYISLHKNRVCRRIHFFRQILTLLFTYNVLMLQSV